MRTDGHDEANSRFSQFANPPKNVKESQCIYSRITLLLSVVLQRMHFLDRCMIITGRGLCIHARGRSAGYGIRAIPQHACSNVSAPELLGFRILKYAFYKTG